MKFLKRAFYIFLILLLVISVPTVEIYLFFTAKSAYNDTYYGELYDMYEKLKTTKEKKIVLIGNSAVAFGANVSFMEEELKDYTVCPFGLYGAIGTKVMLDLSKNYINEDDIVIIIPEINSQAMSLYYSAEEVYRSIDNHYEILDDLGRDYCEKLLKGFFPALQEKYRYIDSNDSLGDGVYSHSSFNKECQMIFNREYNIMPSMYDENDIIDFSCDLLNEDYMNYINNYYFEIYNKGAFVYYDFPPINKSAISTNATINEFTEKLFEGIKFPVIGNINNYLLDSGWFYDSNFHMNSAGSIIYSANLVDDIKSLLGDYSKTSIGETSMPETPIEIVDGDNSQESFFNYEKLSHGYKIISRKEEGKGVKNIIIPVKHNDLPVVSFDKEVFANDETLETITIPSSIKVIYDYSFSGCTSLSKIIMLSTSCNSSCGNHLLDGADKAFIYVHDKDSYLKYSTNYYWGLYSSRITY